MFRNKEYMKQVADILTNEEYKKLKHLKHHHKSVYVHCLMVSYISYKIAKFFNLNYRAAARAGLLHDFFLYDWREHKKGKQKFFEMHGFTHPLVALENANEHFVLCKIEKDMIKKHMFPLTIKPPRYKETWVIVLVDKYVAIVEYIDGFYAIAKSRFKRKKKQNKMINLKPNSKD